MLVENVCTFVLNLQRVKIQKYSRHAKYQNPFQAQNAKISAVSTPILTAKAAVFSILQAGSESTLRPLPLKSASIQPIF